MVMAISLIAALVQHNVEFMLHAIGVCAVAAVVMWIRRTVPLTPALLWSLVAIAAFHMAGGLVAVPQSAPTLGGKVLYNLWLVPGWIKFDQVVHAIGFGIAAVGWWQVLSWMAPHLKPSVGSMMICWIAAQGCGALNEVAEFVSVALLAETNVGRFDNAMLDLVANGVGSGVAVLSIALHAAVSQRLGGRLTSPHRGRLHAASAVKPTRAPLS